MKPSTFSSYAVTPIRRRTRIPSARIPLSDDIRLGSCSLLEWQLPAMTSAFRIRAFQPALGVGR